MMRPIYFRQSRTPSSEQYQLMDGQERLGHLDLHFGASEVFGTLVLERDLPENEMVQLLASIDDDLVLSAEVAREDFIVRVYVGREVSLYSDDLLRDEFLVDGHEDVEEDG